MSNLNFLHSGGNQVTLSAPASNPSNDVTFKLPQDDGSAGEFLKTDGSGNLAFQALGSVGKLIKYAVFTHDGYVTGDYRNAPDVITSGYQLINQSYTPAAANSTIVLFSSSVVMGEDTNQNNNFWLALWNGTTFVSAVSGSPRYLNFRDNLNATTLNYVGSFSAGNTNARNIQMRCGANAGTATTIHINGNANGSYSGSSNRFTLFLAELAP